MQKLYALVHTDEFTNTGTTHTHLTFTFTLAHILFTENMIVLMHAFCYIDSLNVRVAINACYFYSFFSIYACLLFTHFVMKFG